MENGNEIILACASGIKELESIMGYTQRIQSTQNENMRQLFTDNRANLLPHIQNIVVALTEMLDGEEPAGQDGDAEPPAAEDDGEGGDDE